MKRMIFLTILLLTLLGVIRVKATTPQPTAAMRFEHTSLNIGTLQQGGDAIKHNFTFVNEGKAPLVITRTTTSCRCISIVSPKRPVRPGEQGTIEVTFDPKDKGVVNKTIEVHANIPGKTITLLITGEVQ